MQPTPLLGKPIDPDGIRDLRVPLADWLTSPSNHLFAQNIVNRMWGYFLGSGLVEPIDDLRATNPPSNPDLFDALARDFVSNGYDLRLADRGDGLSGGQRQSIALARALAGRPQLLIFDEPSSSMDAQTEADLIARLRPEVAGRTMLLITHRTSLLTLVDRIIVMDRGKIVADGPRDAVLQRLARGKAA